MPNQMNRYGSRNDQRLTSVVDPHHFDADPDVDPDSTLHPDADPDSYFYLMRIRILLSP
jgi:hypothetical protein